MVIVSQAARNPRNTEERAIAYDHECLSRMQNSHGDGILHRDTDLIEENIPSCLWDNKREQFADFFQRQQAAAFNIVRPTEEDLAYAEQVPNIALVKFYREADIRALSADDIPAKIMLYTINIIKMQEWPPDIIACFHRRVLLRKIERGFLRYAVANKLHVILHNHHEDFLRSGPEDSVWQLLNSPTAGSNSMLAFVTSSLQSLEGCYAEISLSLSIRLNDFDTVTMCDGNSMGGATELSVAEDSVKSLVERAKDFVENFDNDNRYTETYMLAQEAVAFDVVLHILKQDDNSIIDTFFNKLCLDDATVDIVRHIRDASQFLHSLFNTRGIDETYIKFDSIFKATFQSTHRSTAFDHEFQDVDSDCESDNSGDEGVLEKSQESDPIRLFVTTVKKLVLKSQYKDAYRLVLNRNHQDYRLSEADLSERFYYFCALSFFHVEEYVSANEVLENALQFAPNSIQLMLLRAAVYLAQSLIDEAFAVLSNVQIHMPDTVGNNKYAGTLFMLQTLVTPEYEFRKYVTAVETTGDAMQVMFKAMLWHVKSCFEHNFPELEKLGFVSDNDVTNANGKVSKAHSASEDSILAPDDISSSVNGQIAAWQQTLVDRHSLYLVQSCSTKKNRSETMELSRLLHVVEEQIDTHFVSDALKEKLCAEYAKQMDPATPMPSCAVCGTRHFLNAPRCGTFFKLKLLDGIKGLQHSNPHRHSTCVATDMITGKHESIPWFYFQSVEMEDGMATNTIHNHTVVPYAPSPVDVPLFFKHGTAHFSCNVSFRVSMDKTRVDVFVNEEQKYTAYEIDDIFMRFQTLVLTLMETSSADIPSLQSNIAVNISFCAHTMLVLCSFKDFFGQCVNSLLFLHTQVYDT